MTPISALAMYCGLIILASLIGGIIPMMVRLTHRRMEVAVSGVAGVMMGVGLLHLLPHALAAGLEAKGAMGSHVVHTVAGPLMLWLLAGFLVMFFIERFFCFHHHQPPAATGDVAVATAVHVCNHHHHDCDVEEPRPLKGQTRHTLTWAGAGVGLSIHSLLEGVALAASIEAGRGHDEGSTAMASALGAFLVIALHKPFDSMTLGALMRLGQRSLVFRQFVNGLFALLVPAGAGLFYLGLGGSESAAQAAIVAAALAFSAGTFLCIATSDLLPELQFHSHDRGKLSAALIIGLAVSWGISQVEARVHGHGHQQAADSTTDGTRELHDDHDRHDHEH